MGYMARREVEKITDPRQRARFIKRTLWIILVLNIVVAGAKYFYGLATHSTAMQADGIHSAFDATGNVIGLISIVIASRPADSNHPYGHAKFETFAASILGALLLVAAFSIGYEAVTNLIAQAAPVQVTPISFIVMFATLVINISVTSYEHYAAKRSASEVLNADAAHTLSDVLVSLGVIVGLFFVWLGFNLADSIAALLVSAMIVYTAVGIFRMAVRSLSDEAMLPEQEILACVLRHPGVRSCHQVRTRGIPSQIYIDFHILVDPLMSVQSSHGLAETIEKDLRQKFPAVSDVTIHIEPDNEKERQEATTIHFDIKKSAD